MRQRDVSNCLLCINFAILLWENTVLLGKNLKAHPRIRIFSQEARTRTRSLKSTKKEWQKCCSLIAVPFGIRGRDIATSKEDCCGLINQRSYSFVASQKFWTAWIHFIDVLQSFKVRSEKNSRWIHGEKNGSAVASDCWFVFVYCIFAHAVCLVRGRSLAASHMNNMHN